MTPDDRYLAISTAWPWQHPWLRIDRLTRAIIAERLTHGATARTDRVLGAIIVERERIERAGWFN